MIINHSDTARFQALSAENDFSVAIVNKAEQVGGTVTPTTLNDCNVTVVDSGAVNTSFDVSVMSYLPHTVSSLTPDVVALDANGIGTFVSAGTAKVQVTTKYGSRVYSHAVVSEPIYSYTEFTSYRANTVRQYIIGAINEAIGGKTPSTSTQAILLNAVYDIAAVNGTSPSTMIRNPSVFSAGIIDVSATTIVTTGRTNGYFPAHLISPRHVIQAKHVKNIDKLVFLDNTNTYRTTNVLRTYDVPGCVDTVVSYLETEITGIQPYYMLPANWLSYMPEVATNTVGEYWIPAFTKKPQPNGDFMRLTGVNIRPSIHHGLPLSAPYTAWRSEIIGGDSGSGLYVPIYENGSIKTVLLDSFYTAAGADNYADVLENITFTMRVTAQDFNDFTPYAPLTVDLSGYLSF